MERPEEGSEAQQRRSVEQRDAGSLRRSSDAALIAAMRRNEHGAFREFFERFAPLIAALARIHRMPARDPDERVTEFLDDAAMRLRQPTIPVPRSLAGYLAVAFRKRSLNAIRDLRRRMLLGDERAQDAGGLGQRVIPSVVSEHVLRVSYGPGAEPPGLSPAVERLALAIERGLSTEERRLLGWLGQRVPQREIALWLGTTHGALRVRVTRLRAQLRDAAFRHANQLDGEERAEIERFFRRIDIVVPVALPPPRARSSFGGTRNPAVEDQH